MLIFPYFKHLKFFVVQNISCSKLFAAKESHKKYFSCLKVCCLARETFCRERDSTFVKYHHSCSTKIHFTKNSHHPESVIIEANKDPFSGAQSEHYSLFIIKQPRVPYIDWFLWSSEIFFKIANAEKFFSENILSEFVWLNCFTFNVVFRLISRG